MGKTLLAGKTYTIKPLKNQFSPPSTENREYLRTPPLVSSNGYAFQAVQNVRRSVSREPVGPECEKFHVHPRNSRDRFSAFCRIIHIRTVDVVVWRKSLFDRTGTTSCLGKLSYTVCEVRFATASSTRRHDVLARDMIIRLYNLKPVISWILGNST